MADLKAEIEREVRQIRMSSMSVSNRELGAQIVALILEHRAQECEQTIMLSSEQGCDRARELRAMLNAQAPAPAKGE